MIFRSHPTLPIDKPLNMKTALMKTSLFIFGVLLISTPLLSQDLLALVSKNGKYGFIDPNGQVAVDFKYDDAYSFHEGFAPILINGKWGYVDADGNERIKAQYDAAEWFWDGLAAVKKDGLWGYIDKSNNVIIPFIYDYTFAFSEGLTSVEAGGQAGFIDGNGSIVIPMKYAACYDFYQGIAPVEDHAGRLLFINKAGEKVDEPFLRQRILLRDKYIFFYKDDLIGVKSVKGKILLEPKFDAIQRFKGKFTFFKENSELYGLIKKNGKIKRNPAYEDVKSITEKMGAVMKNGKWGFIHVKKGVIIAPVYEDVLPFSNGYAAVKKSGKWGFIDRKGKMVVPAVYDESPYLAFEKVN